MDELKGKEDGCVGPCVVVPGTRGIFLPFFSAYHFTPAYHLHINSLVEWFRQ